MLFKGIPQGGHHARKAVINEVCRKFRCACTIVGMKTNGRDGKKASFMQVKFRLIIPSFQRLRPSIWIVVNEGTAYQKVKPRAPLFGA